jgi:hypothetical protein
VAGEHTGVLDGSRQVRAAEHGIIRGSLLPALDRECLLFGILRYLRQLLERTTRPGPPLVAADEIIGQPEVRF